MLYKFMRILKTTLLFVLFYLLSFLSVFADSLIPVENVFLDIKKDYKYYHELQVLYDKWIIEPEEDHKFHPDKLLNRDEFIWIAEETSCKECIIPDVDQEFLDRYKSNPFYDVWINNKYFYCISDAKENNFVLWYGVWVECNDWTQKNEEAPFCVNNNIKLEEALAVVMRMWWIMTDYQANLIVEEIKNWKNYPDLALDLKARNVDSSPYSFYPYFIKALEYEVVDYDRYWNKKIYKLVEKKWDYLRPNQLVTKQDFLKMAYVALKANSCIELEDNNLALKINIFDKICSKEKFTDWKCSLSDLEDDNNIFDFWAEVWWVCSDWIDPVNWYIWRFYNIDTWEQIIKYGEFIDNYNFLTPWNYKIFLRVRDNCWNTWEIHESLYIPLDEEDKDKIDLSVWIDADPIFWNWPLEVDFDAIVNGGKWPYEYIWDFWDWTVWEWLKIKHTFVEKWVYKVKLTVIDSEWNVKTATIIIKVLDNLCEDDSDWDWIDDCSDKCPTVAWEEENSWCRIIIKDPVAEIKVPNCLWLQKNTWFIFWNSTCKTCPCDISIDFRANLRDCDTVIPAITSPDEKDIFYRWSVYQIKLLH